MNASPPANDQRFAIADEISGIAVGSGYGSTTIGIDAALEAADTLIDAGYGLTRTDVVTVSRDWLAQVMHRAVYSRLAFDNLSEEEQADTYKRADAVLAALHEAGVAASAEAGSSE